jgi:hypothetical protein
MWCALFHHEVSGSNLFEEKTINTNSLELLSVRMMADRQQNVLFQQNGAVKLN